MGVKQIVLLLIIFMRQTVIPKIHGMDLLEMLESELSSQPFKELVGHIYPLEIVTYLAASKCTKPYLNGEFFSVALPLQRKRVGFDFSVGDKLVIAEHDQSIWKLYSLSLNCN